MKPTETTEQWPTKDSQGDARGLPGYPKDNANSDSGAAGGRARTPDDKEKARQEDDSQDAE